MVRVWFVAFTALTAILSTTGVLASPSERSTLEMSRDLHIFAKRACCTADCCDAGCGSLGGGAGPSECCSYGMTPCCGVDEYCGGTGGGGGGGGGGACGDDCDGGSVDK